MTDQHDFAKQLKAAIKEWDAEIEKANAKLKSAEADMKNQYEESLRQMREQRNEALDKLNEIQNAGDAAWDDMRKGAIIVTIEDGELVILIVCTGHRRNV